MVATRLAASGTSRHAAFKTCEGSSSRRTSSRRPVVVVNSQQSLEGAVKNVLHKCAVGALAAAVAVVPLTFAPAPLAPTAQAILQAGDPIKNAKAILRYALPIDNKPIRQVQRELESISDALRIPGSKSLGPVSRAVRSAQSIVTNQRKAIIADLAADKKDAGLAALDKLDQALVEFQAVIEAKDKQEVPFAQQKALNYVGEVEEAMVKKLTYEVPPEYANLPRLEGRATMEMAVSLSETPEGPMDVVLTLVADGYNAPLTAGNFVDLVNKKFYDNMEIQRADGFVVQTGDPEGPAEGYVDESGKVRRIPLEIKVQGDKQAIYDFTLEDLGRYNDQPVLPFNAYGTMALARAEFENNSGSSQVFFLLKESELTPSNANLLDGRYATFGYVTQGQDFLGVMKVGDKIKYIKITEGLQYLKNP